MNNEYLHMQKLAGLITESEYQAKMNEDDYDSPLSLTPQQKKVWEDAMIKRYREIAGDDYDDADNVEEALYDLPYATKDILANILLGRKPNKYWENDYEIALEKKGIDLDKFERYADDIEKEFERGNTNNPEIENIQSWVKTWFD